MTGGRAYCTAPRGKRSETHPRRGDAVRVTEPRTGGRAYRTAVRGNGGETHPRRGDAVRVTEPRTGKRTYGTSARGNGGETNPGRGHAASRRVHAAPGSAPGSEDDGSRGTARTRIVLRRRSKVPRGSMMRCWQRSQRRPMSAPRRTMLQSVLPHGCGFRRRTTSPTCTSTNLAVLIYQSRYVRLRRRSGRRSCTLGPTSLVDRRSQALGF